MKKLYLFFLIILFCGLISCTNDWKARLGFECFMNDKLCYKTASYSNTNITWLVLTSKGKEHLIYFKDNTYDNIIDCKVLDNVHTICAVQQLKIPLNELNKYCKDRLIFKEYPKQEWLLKFYVVKYEENLSTPYKITEIKKNELINLGVYNWAQKQFVDATHEIPCD